MSQNTLLSIQVVRTAGVRAMLAAALLATVFVPSAGAQSTSGTSPAGLFYEVSGAGEPVVLIHAFSVDRRMWDSQVAALQGQFRLIRYDLRGHGKSAPPDGLYASYEDLRTVLDALGIERATLIGLSSGAEVATDFALAYPDRVTRLVLASPGLGGYVLPPMPWAQPVFQAAAEGHPEQAAQLWARTPIMALRMDHTATSTLSDLVMSNARLWTYRPQERRLSPPAVTRLSAIGVPVLVLIGDQDLPFIKEIASVLAHGVEKGTLVTIPGAGHMVNLDAPELFNQALLTFLHSGTGRQVCGDSCLVGTS